jgi:hypothetical protein
MKQSVEFPLFLEGHAEMTRVGLGIEVNLIGAMADELVSEKIKRDAILVAPCQLTAELCHIEFIRGVEILAWNRQVKHVVAVAHMKDPSPLLRLGVGNALDDALIRRLLGFVEDKKGI